MEGSSDTIDAKPASRRRLTTVKVGCKYGGFGTTKCYELIKEGRIRAYKFDGRTLIDLDSIDELHAALPRLSYNDRKGT